MLHVCFSLKKSKYRFTVSLSNFSPDKIWSILVFNRLGFCNFASVRLTFDATFSWSDSLAKVFRLPPQLCSWAIRCRLFSSSFVKDVTLSTLNQAVLYLRVSGSLNSANLVIMGCMIYVYDPTFTTGFQRIFLTLFFFFRGRDPN